MTERHYIERCGSCSRIISQCRCASPNKVIRWSTCAECEAKLKAGTHPDQAAPVQDDAFVVWFARLVDDDDNPAALWKIEALLREAFEAGRRT